MLSDSDDGYFVVWTERGILQSDLGLQKINEQEHIVKGVEYTP